jgi:hypothetical protein
MGDLGYKQAVRALIITSLRKLVSGGLALDISRK